MMQAFTPTQIGSVVHTQQSVGQVVPVSSFNWDQLTPGKILEIGRAEEQALSKTLDVYLAKIEKSSNPNLFKLIDRLKDSVEKEDLLSVADQILNGKLSVMDRVTGFFSRKGLEAAKDKALETARDLMAGKSKTLQTVISQMEKELNTELAKLDNELKQLQNIQAEYHSANTAFTLCVDNARHFLSQVKEQPLEDPNNPSAKNERIDKIQMLESRVGALDSTLARLPADIEVIRQLLQSGFSTIQEVSTTAVSRFSSIKMTLLTLHTALVNQGVQRLASKGADLDANLLAVRKKVSDDVCTTSASMAGDSRVTQANQIMQIVNDTVEMMEKVRLAREANFEKFEQAQTIRDEARKIMSEQFGK
jgi:molecular chaperone GrpE (heat shock protein)